MIQKQQQQRSRARLCNLLQQLLVRRGEGKKGELKLDRLTVLTAPRRCCLAFFPGKGIRIHLASCHHHDVEEVAAKKSIIGRLFPPF